MDKPAIVKPGMMQMILETSKVELIRTYGQLTLHQILENKPPSIAALKRVHGDNAERALAVIILEASTAFDEALPKEIAIEAAVELAVTYYSLSLEDFYLMLTQLKKSKIYGRFTINKLLAATEAYFENRCAEAERLSLNKHLAGKYVEPRDKKKYNTDSEFEKFKLQYELKKNKKNK